VSAGEWALLTFIVVVNAALWLAHLYLFPADTHGWASAAIAVPLAGLAAGLVYRLTR
jgi:hypothetical protein